MSTANLKVGAVVLALIVAIIDQVSKLAIIHMFPTEGLGKQITSFFNLVFVYNHGISFGLFNNAPVQAQALIFLAIASVICLILLIWLFRTSNKAVIIALGMIIGGAIGNSIDRVVHGAVVDFLDFYITLNGTAYHWPAFNVADSAVVGGVGLLCLDSLVFAKKSDQE